MTNQKKKSTVTDKVAGMNPAVVTVAGAVIGAGIAAVAAYALKNDKAREKIDEVVSKVGEKTTEFMETMKEDAKVQLEEKAAEAAGDVKKVIESK